MTEQLSKLYLELANVVPEGTKSARDLAYEREIERLRKIEEEANLLLVWTHQDAIDRDIEDGEKWHVNDLHPSVWNGLNSAERDLYHALKQPSLSDTETEK